MLKIMRLSMITNKTIILLMVCVNFFLLSRQTIAIEAPNELQIEASVNLDLKAYIDKVLEKNDTEVLKELENKKLLPAANKALTCSLSIGENLHKDYLIMSAKMVQEIYDNQRDIKQLNELYKVCQETKQKISRKPVPKTKKKMNSSSFPKDVFNKKIESLYIDFLEEKKECASLGADFVIGLVFSIGPYVGGTVCKTAFGQKDFSPTIGVVESSPGNSAPCIGLATGFSKIKSNHRSPTSRMEQYAFLGKEASSHKANRINIGCLIGENCYHLCSSGKIKLGRDLKSVRKNLGFDY